MLNKFLKQLFKYIPEGIEKKERCDGGKWGSGIRNSEMNESLPCILESISYFLFIFKLTKIKRLQFVYDALIISIIT